MTQEELNTMLNRIGIPVRYDHGEKGLKVPFIYYTFERASALNADNYTYHKKNVVSISLVTTSKASQNEYASKLEDLIQEYELPFGDTSEGWNNDEKIYILTYFMEV